MHSRRSFLARGAAGTAALAGLSGCLGLLGDGEGGEWLATLADPRPAVSPGFHVAYDCDATALFDALGDATPFPASVARGATDREFAALPAAAGRFLTAVDEELPEVERSDLDRATGHYYSEVGAADVPTPVPEGEGAVVTGEFTAGQITDWLDEFGSDARLPGTDEYARYGLAGREVQGYATVDGEFVFGTRRETELDPQAVLDTELADGDGSWVREVSPGLAAIARAAGPDDLVVATSFDFPSERPDTGEAAFDEVVASLVAAGLAADFEDGEVTIERTLRYRDGEAPGAEAVETALDRAGEGAGPVPLLGADPSVEGGDRSVTVRTTVATERVRETPAVLRGLPFTGYGNLFVHVDPDDLGRDPPPRVRWTGGIRDDDHVAFEHGGGPPVEDVSVRYVADGEERVVEWEGPIEEGDSFESEAPADPGTDVHIVWRRGTADETVLATVTVAED